MQILSRIVPAHRRTIKIVWLKRDFMQMSAKYRAARRRMTPMDTCYWCRHTFINGEMMALANIKGKGNKVFCQPCIASFAPETGGEENHDDTV